MILFVVQVAIALVLAYSFLRRFLFKSTFDNIPGPPSASWWKGCFSQVFDQNGWNFHRDLLEKYGNVVRIPMLFGSEELYVCDPRALQHIIVKDQYIYEETSAFITTNRLTFGTSLLSTLGDHHRRQRKMLNPVFSLKHMRDLLPIFSPIASDLRNVVVELVKNGQKEIDMLGLASKAALEFIGQGGFGYTFNALHDGARATEYGDTVKQMSALAVKMLLPRRFVPWFVKIGPPAFRRKLAELLPSKRIKEALTIVDILDSGSKMIYQEKKTALENGDETTWRKIGMGKDILSILMRANMQADKRDKLPEEEIIGQLNTFIFAGQETTSHAIARALHLLTLHPQIQSRLRDEITSAKKGRGDADFDYDTLMGLPYLDAVCRETLRVYAPLSTLQRTYVDAHDKLREPASSIHCLIVSTRKDVVMPLAWPILSADGETEMKEIPIKKGTNILISIIGANRHKRIWGEDAEEWKPERWLKPLPESVAKAHMPGVMTFIGGGRACIGFKFAEMEIKLVLATLLESFEFGPGPDIDWTMVGIARPVLKNTENKQLPLKVSLLNDA